MKLSLKVLLFCMLPMLAAACGDSGFPESMNSHRGKRTFKVNLSIGGDFIEQGESPLTRADGDDATYIGINVTAKKDGESNYHKFAYGVFDNQDDMTLELMSDYVYRFEVTTVSKSTDVFKQEGSPNKVLNKPFYKTVGSTEGSFEVKSMNKFIFSDTDYLNHISEGAAHVATPSSSVTQLYNYPRIERYYGTLSNFRPSGDNCEVEIPVDRMNFGIHVDVTGLPENTTLTWTHRPSSTKSEAKIQFDGALMTGKGAGEPLEWEDIYSMYYFSETTASRQTETIDFAWKRAESVVEYHSVTFTPTRNVMKIFKIDFDKLNTQSGASLTIKQKDEPKIGRAHV